ncbi:MAG: DUF6880 family protein [Caulobacteraceae bacterium]
MARKAALSEETLAALGAERLARLLMELGEADATVRKRLALAAAEAGGPGAQIKAIDRRLTALAKARSFVPWERAKAFAAELDGLRAAIGIALAAADPAAAAERLVRFIAMARAVIDRVEDSGERTSQVFRAAAADLAAAWTRMEAADPIVLAAEVFRLVEADDYGVCDGLAEAAAPALEEAGLAALAGQVQAALAMSGKAEGGRDGWGQRRLRQLLGDVADARHDVDAFIAAQTIDGGRPDRLEIAERLLGADRAAEALTWLEREETPRIRVVSRLDLPMFAAGLMDGSSIDTDVELLRIVALERLGRRDAAQQVRWRLFESSLEAPVLRDFVRALPDFEEFEHVDRAFELATAHPAVLRALVFFIEWPKLDLAARLVEARIGEIDGGAYVVLAPAAEALEEAQPRAATLLLRRMIDSILERAASQAYHHAARHLAACAELSGRLDAGDATLPSHADYLTGLRARHGRKAGFWAAVGA